VEQWSRPENIYILDPRKVALAVIDMQNFSCVPASGCPLPHIAEVITTVNRLADFCREVNIPVIWVCHNFTSTGKSDDAGLYPLFHDKAHMQNTMNHCTGTELHQDMHFSPSSDHLVFKNRYSAFLSNPPELLQKLDSLKRTQLLIAGIAANVCVESTARDAMQLDYEVVLVSDGVTATDDGMLASTLANTRLFFGDVRSAGEIIKALAGMTT
jgi:ureidoacrylate peracid hydrolase